MTNHITVDNALQALREIDRDSFRSNKNKILRECWCVARALQLLERDVYVLVPEKDQSHFVDVRVINPDKPDCHVNVQVVEIAPEHRHAKEVLASAISCGYSNLRSELFELISRVVKQKTDLYTSEDRAGLNLLIYFNPPSGEEDENGLAFTVMASFEIDLPTTELRELRMDFGSVIFMSSSEAAFIHGNDFVYV